MACVIRPRTITTKACPCFSLVSHVSEDKSWARDPETPDASRLVLLDLQASVLLDLQAMSDWRFLQLSNQSLALRPELSLDEGVLVQCLPVPKSPCPRWNSRFLRPRQSGTSHWCRKPIALTHHLYSELITKSSLAPAHQLKENHMLPSESSARGGLCTMCPVRIGNSCILPCCLCENWHHANCSYQSHLGRAYPSHVRILDPRHKIIIMSHPYLEAMFSFQ